MSNRTKSLILHATALGVDIVPPFIATVCQFPLWIEESSDATMSGIALLLIFFCCLPFVNQIKAFLKSPSIPVVWAVVYILFTMLQNIIDQMVVVAFVGLVSNLVGTGLYKWGDMYKKDEVEDKED